MRDYQEFAWWTDRIFGPGKALADLKSASPDKKRALADDCGYYLFIARSLTGMGREIYREAELALAKR